MKSNLCRTYKGCLLVSSLCLLLASCGQAAAPTAAPPLPTQLLRVDVSQRQLAVPSQQCSNTFVERTLDHVTTVVGNSVSTFDGNGSGLAVNDLDNDGDQDLVFANLKGANTILWNQGGLDFRSELLPHGDSRAASIVDVDGDGWQDIVFTRQLKAPTWWRNTAADTGKAAFVQASLPGVYNNAYALTWGDLRGDGSLDLITGSYDAALEKDMGFDFQSLGGKPAGVFLYERRGDSFESLRLWEQAQALAITLPDIDSDGRADIMVGNDFDEPDRVWLQRDDGWDLQTRLFKATTFSTMGFDLGDIDNDGSPELFATDMKPYDHSVGTIASWLPMMSLMSHNVPRDDPQIMENVLQVRGGDGRFRNYGYQQGVDATGWSWSGKFGDLDSDGFLDLYVVNGMIAAGLFKHLPNNELVEQNQARRNDGSGMFVPAPEWGLGSIQSGRGMSMADLDEDGDLDIVVNNLLTAARLYENRLCGGSNLQADLRWPTSLNTRAIGARLVLRTSAGNYYRDVRADSGYLSGDSARVHFGFPADATLQRLEIYWPDGNVSSLDAPAAGNVLTITR